MTDPRQRLANNPFYVLGLRPDCSRAEVEREGQKLLGMLELGMPAASHYRSPVGRYPRSPEQVREAMAELRDPQRRLVHELWAALETPDAASADAGPTPAGPEAFEDEPDPSREPAGFSVLAMLGFGDAGRWRRG